MRALRILAVCALLIGAPRVASAQIGLVESLFHSLDAVGGFWVYAGFLPTSSVMTAGKPGAPQKQSGVQGPGMGFMFHLANTSDSAWAFQLAIAYSRITGFRSQDPTFDLRGSLMELPRLAWFAEYHPRKKLSPYLGVHMGVVQLQSAAIYDSSGALYPIGGSTYEVGAAVGAAANLRAGGEAFSLFVEPGYTLRNIVSLDWSGSNNKVIPARFPRALRFTGWEVAAGVEFGVPRNLPGH